MKDKHQKMNNSPFIPHPSSLPFHPFAFPKNAAFGKALPKNRIYEHANVPAGVKTLFVREVDKIIWAYKLSPETINLPPKGDVEEIEIFHVSLKTGTVKDEVLSAMDKAIPSPILFVLSYENRIRYVAAHKRQNEADKSKWVISGYFETIWMPENSKKVILPVALDLWALYHTLLKRIIPLPVRENETLADLISRAENVKVREREAAKVEVRLKKEKQFNRKVELNRSLNELRAEIRGLTT